MFETVEILLPKSSFSAFVCLQIPEKRPVKLLFPKLGKETKEAAAVIYYLVSQDPCPWL